MSLQQEVEEHIATLELDQAVIVKIAELYSSLKSPSAMLDSSMVALTKAYDESYAERIARFREYI